MQDTYTALRKALDAARAALAGLVALAVVLSDNSDALHLPSGVTAALAGLVAFGGQWAIRRKTTPDAVPDPSQVPELADTPEFASVAELPRRGEPEEVVRDG